MNYQTYYREQLERGLQYQDFVYEILARHGLMTVAYGSKLFQQRLGENKAKMEIKCDGKFHDTGNLCIETAEKATLRGGDYVPSGIQRDCVEYVIGDYDDIFRFSTNILRHLWKVTDKYGGPLCRRYQTPTSQGFLVRKEIAEQLATHHIKCDCGQEMVLVIRADEEKRGEANALLRKLMQKAHVDPAQISIFENNWDTMPWNGPAPL